MTIQKSPEQIADELADSRRKPFTAFGKQWQGDIFYSDIHRAIKGYSKRAFTAVFQAVCRLLEQQGFYIHS